MTDAKTPLVRWCRVFQSLRHMLRERAIAFTAEEPADLAPIVRVDTNLDPSMRVDLFKQLLDIDSSPPNDFLISGQADGEGVSDKKERSAMSVLDLMSQSQAAKLLGTNKAAVGKFAGSGLLTTHRRHGRKMYPASEVQELAELRDRGLKPRRIGEDLLALRLELTKLRRYLENVCAHVGVSDKFVTYTDDELVGWYDKARKYVEAHGHEGRDFQFSEWIVVLANINEAELKRLEKLTDDKMPFVVFIRLCEKVIELASPMKEKHARGPRLYLDWIFLFAMARDKMRSKAMVFLSERRPGVSPARLMDLAISGRLSLLNIDLQGRKVERMTTRETSGPIMLKGQRHGDLLQE